MKKIFFLLLLTIVSGYGFADTITVTNLNNDGEGSLRNAISNATDGDEINFDSSLLVGDSPTLVLESEIAFSKSLTIRGLLNDSDTLHISGNNSHRIFNIFDTGFVTIDSFHLLAGNAVDEKGGAIFIENSAGLTIKNSSISNCTANSGGAVAVVQDFFDAIITLENTKIFNNNAAIHGGGVYVYGDTFSVIDLIMNTSFFTNNHADEELDINYSSGGGLYMFGSEESQMNLSLTSSVFNGNTANSGGGINIKSFKTSLSLVNSYINNNNSNLTSINNSKGGGIYYYSYKGDAEELITIVSSHFNNNTSGKGGAVYFEFFSQEVKTRALISSTTFNGNSAEKGSAVYHNLVTALFSINYNNTNFIANETTGGTGAIYVSGFAKNLPGVVNSFTIDDCLFDGNVGGAVTYYADGYGEAIVLIRNTDFINNTSVLGGAINIRNDLYSSHNFYFESVDFENNEAESSGGAIYYFDESSSLLSFDKVNFISNSGGNFGGGVYLTGYIYTNDDSSGLIEVNNVVYEGNTSVNGGGALYINSNYRVNINKATFIDNSSLANGGGVYVSLKHDQFDYFTLINSTFENNIAAESGGGLFLVGQEGSNVGDNYNMNFNLRRSTFTGNSANNGGAFAIDAKYFFNIDIHTNTFHDNSATLTGGGIYVTGDPTFEDYNSIEFKNNTIVENEAIVFGSGIAFNMNADMNSNLLSNIIVNSSGSNIYFSSESNVESDGYNIFSDESIDISVSTDQLGMDYEDLNLAPLADYGKDTHTRMPQDPSVAIDTGNPFDISDPQNAFTNGIRDAGAAEFCASTFETIVVSTCDSYTWINGQTYTESNNTATYTISNAAGCDSIISLDLTISDSSSSIDNQVVCDSFTWIDGLSYTSDNNTAVHVLAGANANGCDSIVTLNLTILESSESVDVVSSCDPYTWIDGETYTVSNNVATHTLTNAIGCDSIITLDFTLLSDITTETVSICDSFTWEEDGNTYTESNNTASVAYVNSLGCDSIVMLDLTIIEYAGIEQITSCNSYTWIDDVEYTESNNTASYTIPNAASNGCDSTVYLDLTILNSTGSIDTQEACSPFTWIDGVDYTETNNTATYILTNAAGCDSIITLDLKILETTYSIDEVSTCENSFTWVNGNTYGSSTNSATHTLVNAAGCDSIVTLNLTMNNIDPNVTIYESTLSAAQVGATYQWVDCWNQGEMIEGATSISYTPEESGNFAVIINLGECTETSECYWVNPVGISENAIENSIKLYPNPTSDWIYIDGVTKAVESSYQLMNVFGQQFRTGQFSEEQLSLSVHDLPNGLYILQLIVDGEKFSFIFEKIH